MKKPGAFTLIELLIVVAIIGILAAIAVPNFLNAQVRAGVSRVKADFKAISTAMELYYLDNNDYPPDVTGPNDETLSYRVLTSPIAYVNNLEIFRDYFTSKAGRSDEGGFIRNFYDYGGGSARFADKQSSFYHIYNVGYVIISFAPDRSLQYPWGESACLNLKERNQAGRNYLYDSSNGLNSLGDLIITGMGIMNQ